MSTAEMMERIAQASPSLKARIASVFVSETLFATRANPHVFHTPSRPVNLQELSAIVGSALGNQAESPAPRFVGKLMQLSASSFCISSLDLDLA